MTMMTDDKITILFCSDLHFGIPSGDQEDMANAFRLTVFPLIPEADILFINGDFFDTLVSFNGHGFDPIYDTIMSLFALCEHHKVILRIMQGTWTHDRNQCRRFTNFYKNSKFSFNYKFVETIDLEEIAVKDRSLKILYVPDDLPFKASSDIVDVITSKMTEIGWDHVDYACMHGFFDFTFPSGVSRERRIVFEGSQFPFVKKLIDVGHVHHHRIKDNAISNGSFDRLCHNEEEAKGLVKVFDYPDYYTAQFIENKHAAIFNTLVFSSEDTTEDLRTKISDHLSSLVTKRKISLRFLVGNLGQREAIRAWMKEVHPDVALSFKKANDVDDHLTVIPTSSLLTAVEKRNAPTMKTIASAIRAHIPEAYQISIPEIDAYLVPS